MLCNSTVVVTVELSILSANYELLGGYDETASRAYFGHSSVCFDSWIPWFWGASRGD